MRLFHRKLWLAPGQCFDIAQYLRQERLAGERARQEIGRTQRVRLHRLKVRSLIHRQDYDGVFRPSVQPLFESRYVGGVQVHVANRELRGLLVWNFPEGDDVRVEGVTNLTADMFSPVD